MPFSQYCFFFVALQCDTVYVSAIHTPISIIHAVAFLNQFGRQLPPALTNRIIICVYIDVGKSGAEEIGFFFIH